jgi:O-antigen/teichoic acid export membrane protein
LSSLRGIVKNLSALFASHVIAILQQVALVPVFIHVYGKAGYGEWLSISAAVSYLGTLDFGVQTFVKQDLTIRYQRGEMEQFHVVQSTAMRLLLGMVSAAALVALVAFALPMQHLLKMDGVHGNPVIAPHVVQAAIYFVALQPLLGILYGYFSGMFMVLGRAHVGAQWQNVRIVTQLVVTLVAVLLHANFAQIAFSATLSTVICLLLQMLHFYRVAPEIFPTVRLWDGELVRTILGQSGYFGLIFGSNFLVYQVPVLILESTVGGAAVTTFSLMRTIFSMTRILLNTIPQSVAPEVTKLFAKHDWKGLKQLYDYSERLVCAIVPAVNVGVLYLSPFLLQIWVRQPQLFVPHVYLVAAATSLVMSMEEQKFQFQFATNTHKDLAKFMFGTYILLGLVWMFVIPRFGIAGLLWCWLAVEFSQLIYLVFLNARLFRGFEILDKRYLGRMLGLSAVFFAAAAFLLPLTKQLRLPAQVGIAVANGAILLAIAIPLYHLISVWGKLQGLLRKRFA